MIYHTVPWSNYRWHFWKPLTIVNNSVIVFQSLVDHVVKFYKATIIGSSAREAWQKLRVTPPWPCWTTKKLETRENFLWDLYLSSKSGRGKRECSGCGRVISGWGDLRSPFPYLKLSWFLSTLLWRTILSLLPCFSAIFFALSQNELPLPIHAHWKHNHKWQNLKFKSFSVFAVILMPLFRL